MGMNARHTDPPRVDWITKWCEEASEWILLDLLTDLATMALLATGTVLAFRALVGT